MNNSEDMLRDLAKISFSDKKYTKSMEYWREYLENFSEDNDSLYEASLAARYAKNYQLAEEWLTRGSEKYSTDRRFYLDHAKLAMNQRKWSVAVNILESTPDDIITEEFFHFLAICYYRLEKPLMAIKVLKEGCQRYPSDYLLPVELMELEQEYCSLDTKIIVKNFVDNTFFKESEPRGYKEKTKILHLVRPGRFTFQFMEFITDTFDLNQHKFLMLNKREVENWPLIKNIEVFPSTFLSMEQQVSKLADKIKDVDRVILHSIFDTVVVETLYKYPEYLKKCYWFLWGGDLYYKNNSSLVTDKHILDMRKRVIKDMAYLVCHNPKYFKFARDNFSCNAEFIRCFKYPSNMAFEEDENSKVSFPFLGKDKLTIFLGNSASPYNQHEELLQLLSNFKDENIQVVCPLSYGDKVNAYNVAQKGKKMLGDKFYPLMEHMDYNSYCALLSQVNLAIFSDDIDQGMGTIRQLLAFGKKVYVNHDHGVIELMEELGVKVFELKDFSLIPNFPEQKKNIELMRQHYSRSSLLHGLSKIFDQVPK